MSEVHFGVHGLGLPSEGWALFLSCQWSPSTPSRSHLKDQAGPPASQGTVNLHFLH